MEQNNIQTPIVSEDKQKIRAKWFLIILLAITFIFIGFRIYSILSNHFVRSIFIDLLKYPTSALIFYSILIVLIFLNFLPYMVTRKLYKQSKYLKQVIWGILLFLITQIVILLFMGVLFYPVSWEGPQKESLNPCVPGPGVVCN